MRARPIPAELTKETRAAINRIADVGAESATQDIRLLKLYGLWDEARVILLGDEESERKSVFQSILYEKRHDWCTHAQQYKNGEKIAEKGSILRGLMVAALHDLKDTKKVEEVAFWDVHIPSAEVLQFILEQYAFYVEPPPQGS